MSLNKYLQVTEGKTIHYSKMIINRQSQLTYTRIRLGYKYVWQYMNGVNPDDTKCKVCHTKKQHFRALSD